MLNVLIWGTGEIAKRTVKYSKDWNIIGYIESVHTIDVFNGKKVYIPNDLPKDFDVIIVANSHATEIYRICLENDFPMDKIIFLCGVKRESGLTDRGRLYDVLGEVNYNYYCASYGIVDDRCFIVKDASEYTKLNKRSEFNIDSNNMWPILSDKYEEAGSVHNYFLQDLWAAKKIIDGRPDNHFDIGSRLDGFIAHLLSAGIPVKMIDIRKFPVEIEGLDTIVDDATELKHIEDSSITSISALCSLEHFGLGRYGDPVDPEACFRCFERIQKKVKKGGKVYISVPVGKERIEFNAHRVFKAQTIVDCFGELTLLEFSCASEKRIEKHVSLNKYNEDPHNGEYRYGLFEFIK